MNKQTKCGRCLSPTYLRADISVCGNVDADGLIQVLSSARDMTGCSRVRRGVGGSRRSVRRRGNVSVQMCFVGCCCGLVEIVLMCYVCVGVQATEEMAVCNGW
jgi:hypothetical protein